MAGCITEEADDRGDGDGEEEEEDKDRSENDDDADAEEHEDRASVGRSYITRSLSDKPEVEGVYDEGGDDDKAEDGDGDGGADGGAGAASFGSKLKRKEVGGGGGCMAIRAAFASSSHRSLNRSPTT
jgi:hypothetical protein